MALLLSAWAGGVALAGNWPCFRGPSRQGLSREKRVPLRWSQSEGIAWKTEVPGQGWSSPIVWGRQVFVTTAAEEGQACRVLSLDRDSGRVLWDKEVFRQNLKRKERKNSYATPTPVTDGKAVYAAFGDGSFVALRLDGTVLWINRDFPFYSQHGLGASLVLHGDLLIQPRDGSSEGEDKKLGWQKPWDQSYVLALDKGTGQVRWQGRRGLSRIAHVTPNIATVAGSRQLISPAGDVIQGFDLASGKLLWTVRSQGEGVVPSVVIGGGMCFSASGFEKPTIRAVRLGGQGDVTATHIAWEQTRNVPKIPSMVLYNDLLFSVTENGIASCMDAKTGVVKWQERLGGNFSASPVAAAGRIYFLSEEGETTVLAAASEFQVLARNKLEGHWQASPAISGGRLFLRSDRYVYGIQGR